MKLTLRHYLGLLVVWLLSVAFVAASGQDLGHALMSAGALLMALVLLVAAIVGITR